MPLIFIFLKRQRELARTHEFQVLKVWWNVKKINDCTCIVKVNSKMFSCVRTTINDAQPNLQDKAVMMLGLAVPFLRSYKNLTQHNRFHTGTGL